jgi:hypothetical protein
MRKRLAIELISLAEWLAREKYLDRIRWYGRIVRVDKYGHLIQKYESDPVGAEQVIARIW